MCQHADGESHLTLTPRGERGWGGNGLKLESFIETSMTEEKLFALRARLRGDTPACASRFCGNRETEAADAEAALLQPHPTPPISHWNNGSLPSATAIGQRRYGGGRVENSEWKAQKHQPAHQGCFCQSLKHTHSDNACRKHCVLNVQKDFFFTLVWMELPELSPG